MPDSWYNSQAQLKELTIKKYKSKRREMVRLCADYFRYNTCNLYTHAPLGNLAIPGRSAKQVLIGSLFNSMGSQK